MPDDDHTLSTVPSPHPLLYNVRNVRGTGVNDPETVHINKSCTWMKIDGTPAVGVQTLKERMPAIPMKVLK
jgi:hypothetical protein